MLTLPQVELKTGVMPVEPTKMLRKRSCRLMALGFFPYPPTCPLMTSAARAAPYTEPEKPFILLATVGSTLFPDLTNKLLSPSILSLLPSLGVTKLIVQYGRADILALTEIEDVEVDSEGRGEFTWVDYNGLGEVRVEVLRYTNDLKSLIDKASAVISHAGGSAFRFHHRIVMLTSTPRLWLGSRSDTQETVARGPQYLTHGQSSSRARDCFGGTRISGGIDRGVSVIPDLKAHKGAASSRTSCRCSSICRRDIRPSHSQAFKPKYSRLSSTRRWDISKHPITREQNRSSPQQDPTLLIQCILSIPRRRIGQPFFSFSERPPQSSSGL